MNESMDRALVDWLRDGPEFGPREGLERALAATRRTSQRPGWSFPERWLPMQLSMARTPSLRPILSIATIALLILALGAAAVLMGSARRAVPPPFGPAGNGAVVFEKHGDLLIADAIDGTARTLVSGPETDTFPTFSNQGDRLAFVREADGGFLLMSAQPDGTDVRQLASFPGGIDGYRWSPDGSTILLNYSETDPDGFRLAIVNTDGSGSRPFDVGTAADWASWRPGRSQIAFRGRLEDGQWAAFIADADGTDPRQLPIDLSGGLDFEGMNWSPDGTRLAFMSGSLPGGPPGWQIGVADIGPEGEMTDFRRLRLDPESYDEMLPRWSPDSSQFSFIHMRDNMYQIGLARPDGTGFRLVGPRTVHRNGLGYAWAPDGRTLLIATLIGVRSWWSVDATTGAATELQVPADQIPAWQRLAG